jgi:threonine/homoserine/homoserine lactone efflux protein
VVDPEEGRFDAPCRPGLADSNGGTPEQGTVTPRMSFAAFLLAAILLAITPGPGLAYVVARTVAGGRPEGLASCFGTGLGGMLHVLAAALGISLLIAQSATAFNVVKYVGAAYLFYLGVRLLLRKQQPAAITPVASLGVRRAFLEGVLVEALNVKTALFFLAFLPQFVSPVEPLIPQLVLLGSICVALNTLVDVMAVLGADRLLRSEAARAARGRLLARMSGVTMLGLGAWLALARREG